MDADSMIWQRSGSATPARSPSTDDAGTLDGLVLEDQLWAIPTERRRW